MTTGRAMIVDPPTALTAPRRVLVSGEVCPSCRRREGRSVSRFLSVYHRQAFEPATVRQRVEAILLELAPEPARARVEVQASGQHALGTLNLSAGSRRHGLALCQGKLYERADDWWLPGSGVPDGSYALVWNRKEAKAGDLPAEAEIAA